MPEVDLYDRDFLNIWVHNNAQVQMTAEVWGQLSLETRIAFGKELAAKNFSRMEHEFSKFVRRLKSDSTKAEILVELENYYQTDSPVVLKTILRRVNKKLHKVKNGEVLTVEDVYGDDEWKIKAFHKHFDGDEYESSEDEDEEMHAFSEDEAALDRENEAVTTVETTDVVAERTVALEMPAGGLGSLHATLAGATMDDISVLDFSVGARDEIDPNADLEAWFLNNLDDIEQTEEV